MEIDLNCDLAKCPESPIPLDFDSEGSDACDAEYASTEFELCLREVETAIANGASLLDRSRIYLGRIKNMHDFMLLPPKKFDEVDDALIELLECTFPADVKMDCLPNASFAEEQLLVFKIAEKELIEEMHKNEHVCKLHKCNLPEKWDNLFDS